MEGWDELQAKLCDQNKVVRKQALQKIVSQLKKDEPVNENADTILRAMVPLMQDPSERCRELAAEVVCERLRLCADKQEIFDSCIPLILPAIAAALTRGEECEEVRLSTITALQTCVRGTSNLLPYLQTLIPILTSTLTDSFPSVVQVCCECVVGLCNNTGGRIRLYATPLMKSLVFCCAHRHAKIRALAFKALGSVVSFATEREVSELCQNCIQCGSWDEHVTVREASLFCALAVITMQLETGLRDQLLMAVMLSVLLMCSCDDVLELQNTAKSKIDQVADKFRQVHKGDVVGTTNKENLIGFLIRDLIRNVMLPLTTGWTTTERARGCVLAFGIIHCGENVVLCELPNVLISLCECVCLAPTDEILQEKALLCCEELGRIFPNEDLWIDLVKQAFNVENLTQSLCTPQTKAEQNQIDETMRCFEKVCGALRKNGQTKNE